MGFTYRYARPALTADCVVFGLDEEDLKVLLIQRDLEPFAGMWALPGGFATVGESIETTARRELLEETGLKNVFLEQLYTFSEPDRDPREHVVTVAFYALVNLSEHKVQAATDARNAAWFAIDDIPKLAFDHDKMLKVAYERLKGKIRYQPIGFELLADKFTLSQLQGMYEKILDRELDKRNFRKKILNMEIIEELDEIETDVAHRAARLYRFNKKKYDEKVKEGFNFEL
ncbi:MAG TPA: NUDIX hydrolase [Lentisphaeria bacterium]|nr:MAG: NUDIX hydrolase [Lentisphaerae bacterium GWF2_50_93]HCE44772.1 NUDIX hydrolase [Lentisphaeria bacterium]